MSSHQRNLAAALAAAAVAAVAASPAAASPPPGVHCGQTLTTSVKLTADLSDCPGDGLIVGASGITVDLNGHTIDGVSSSTDCDRPDHLTAGIANRGVYDGITVENGTIRQFDLGFDAGSQTDGMSDSRIQYLVVRDNRLGGISIGSGEITSVVRNRVEHNVVSGSPCGPGVKLNTGLRNRVAGNRIDDVGTGVTICCGADNDGNVAEGNRISHTFGSGVEVFLSGAARIVGNVTSDTGGDGITLVGPASRASVIVGNVITRSQFSGVNVEGCPDCGAGPALDRVRVEGNRMSSVGDGIILFETDDDVVRGNSVSGAGSFGTPELFGTGVLMDGVSRTDVVANRIADGGGVLHAAILVGGVPPEFEPSSRPVDANVVAANVVVGQHDGDGILVGADATGTVVRGNLASRNDADGIHVRSASTTLLRNGAFGNGALGIEAVPGVTDGGGNLARGNGDAAQCAGVACG